MLIEWSLRLAWAGGVVAAFALYLHSLPVPTALLAAICLGTLLTFEWRRIRVTRRFRDEWLPQGKDVLLVYSNSPHWRSYIEETWLPRWGDRAVVLNWSERSTWGSDPSSAVELFRALGGTREFNPLVIVVPASGEVRVVRFWKAFRAYKHGRTRLLAAAEAELAKCLGCTEASTDTVSS